MSEPLLRVTEAGFYCEIGQFFIDPWQPVERAVVTHAHADHYTFNCRAYLVAQPGEALFRARLGAEARLQTLPYGERVVQNGVTLSFHPAGHILGSAQVRLERGGEVWVVSGDYKVDPDITCSPFELVKCDHFITEATFGMPIYRWPPQFEVYDAINAWWRKNQQAGQASILYAYALGKAQRVLSGVDASMGPIYTHGTVEGMNHAYRQAGVSLPLTRLATQVNKPSWSQALIIAPPSAMGTPWLRRFGAQSSAFASGWMRIRGMRRRRSIDRGFVLSDHADWPALMDVITATGAQHIGVTHGYVPVVVRYLHERGLQAQGYSTRFTDEEGEAAEPE